MRVREQERSKKGRKSKQTEILILDRNYVRYTNWINSNISSIIINLTKVVAGMKIDLLQTKFALHPTSKKKKLTTTLDKWGGGRLCSIQGLTWTPGGSRVFSYLKYSVYSYKGKT